LQNFAFEIVLSIAVGSAWVAALGGAYLAFNYIYPYGLLAALCAAVLGMLPGLVVVVVLEGAKKLFEILAQLKKQSSLLEKIIDRLPSKDNACKDNG
jgi:hypothetical protein